MMFLSGQLLGNSCSIDLQLVHIVCDVVSFDIAYLPLGFMTVCVVVKDFDSSCPLPIIMFFSAVTTHFQTLSVSASILNICC